MFESITYILLALMIFVILIFPVRASVFISAAMKLCAYTVFPSLFPFMVLASTVVSTGFAALIGNFAKKPVMRFFKLPGAAAVAVIVGFLSGYPVGASCAVEMYQNKVIEKCEAERLLAFCNNTGPAFIIVAVGIQMFRSAKTGILLYFSHVISALIIGALFARNVKTLRHSYGRTSAENPVLPLHIAFVSAVKTSAMNLVYISAFVIFFSVITGFLGVALSNVSAIVRCAVFGICEITSAAASAAQMLGASPISLVLTSAFLGWAGLSVHAQVLSIIADSDLSPKKYLLGKALHGAVSAAVTFVFVILQRI